MLKVSKICDYLGEPYAVRKIDNGEAIIREFENGYEFEVVVEPKIVLYVWQRKPHTELMNIYSDIADASVLKDVLGSVAFSIRNLQAEIRVEREALKL